MTEQYSLVGDTLPVLPVPHDCVITSIQEDDGWLILQFEHEISRHDSIAVRYPSADSLIIRYHLTYPEIDLFVSSDGSTYHRKKRKKLFKLPEKRWQLEYLYHYISSNTLLLELFAGKMYSVQFHADTVVYEWL